MDAQEEKEIAELKELVQKDIAIGDETRQMVLSMRRSARWDLVFQIFYWLLILGFVGASYYYITPYVAKLFGIYQSIEGSNAQNQNIFQNLQQSLQSINKFAPSQQNAASSTR